MSQQPLHDPNFSPGQPAGMPQTSGLAIASLVLGILAPCTCVTSIPAAICGIWGLVDISRSGGSLKGTGMAVAGLILSVVAIPLTLMAALLLPAVTSVRHRAQRIQSQNNVKMQVISLHNYESVNRRLPRYANFDANGRPLLSWRVHILPYVEEQNLYERFHLDEPWDSPHNRTLLNRMPSVYRIPGDSQTPPDHTRYLAVTGPGTVFAADQALSLAELSGQDGASNTIAIIEVPPEQAVPWTKPADWDYTAPGAMSGFEYEYNVGFFDGSVHAISGGTSPDQLRPAFTYDGQEPPVLYELIGN